MYLVLKNCRANGRALKAGDVVDIEKDVAETLLTIGRIEKTEAKVEEAPVIETKVEKPKRTRKAK